MFVDYTSGDQTEKIHLDDSRIILEMRRGQPILPRQLANKK